MSEGITTTSNVISSELESSIVKEELSHLKNRIPAPSEYLLDDFKNGIDKNKWYISVGNWSSAVSNGLKAENVGYTKEDLLVLKANGEYYPDSEMKLTGAALVSKETMGPGKYEVVMKVMPRLGACTAFWTFYYENDHYNHEIDIELPGSKSYEYVMNTNWIGVGSKEHTSKIIKTPTPANDGKWHKYTFEWHTNPKVIKYYVDDELTAITDDHVPTANGQLWIGVWFPNKWAGEPLFESDYLLVDWISYQPFAEPSIKTEPSSSRMAPLDAYPTKPITITERNYISNSNFEVTNNAWKYQDDNAYLVSSQAYEGNRSLLIFNNSSAWQNIEAVYDNYNFEASFHATLEKGEKGEFRVNCLDENNEVINEGKFTFTIEDTKEYAVSFKTVEGTKSIVLSYHSIDGSIILIDKVILNLKNS